MTTTFRVLLRRALPVFLAVLVLGTSAAQATTVRRMSFTEVVNEAELIAIGKVTAIRNTWNADLGMPFTEVTFSDVEVLKGAVDGAELTLRFLGGRAPDGMTLKVAGMPRFTVGDRAAVFSAGNGLEACPLVGWWQGFYRLLFDAGQEAFTVANHAGQPVVAIDGGGGQIDGGGGQIDGGGGQMEARLSLQPNDDVETIADALTLDEFRTAVRTAVQ